jgi:hypothetical protein
MPWWLKDITLGYGVVAAAFARVEKRDHETRYGEPLRFWRFGYFERSAIWRALWWPLALANTWWWALWRIPRVRTTSGYTPDQGDFPLSPATIKERTAEYVKDAQKLSTSLIWQIFVILVCSAAFFLWNHLQNVFGPGG